MRLAHRGQLYAAAGIPADLDTLPAHSARFRLFIAGTTSVQHEPCASDSISVAAAILKNAVAVLNYPAQKSDKQPCIVGLPFFFFCVIFPVRIFDYEKRR